MTESATLFDGLGRVVRVVALTQGAATLDVRGLATGLYIVRCGTVAQQVLIQR